MPYEVWCSVDGCPLEEDGVESVDRIFDLQDSHRDRLGDHHVLEFEREDSSLARLPTFQ